MPHSWDLETEHRYSNGFGLEQMAISCLKIFAWLDLIAGIAVAVFILVGACSTERSSDLYVQMANTMGEIVAIGIAIGAFIQGLFVWAFFLVIAYTASNIITIRDNTTPKPQPPA